MSRTTLSRTPSRSRARSTLWAAVVALLVVVASATVLGMLIPPSASSSASSFGEGLRDGDGAGAPVMPDGDVTDADGLLPDGVTVFDTAYPGVGNLDPDLLNALREAASDAAQDGIAFVVNSGWRSAEYQERLLEDAVGTYGSAAEAARWVATASTSAHVSGDAVDIGDFEADAWLSSHGSRYGLCPIYDNEPWHFELRDEAVEAGCPATFADPTEDPRMQQ
ncbi:M15 family metallopeptidase [Agromyces humi]|uniref:M15 family metallopeptidase n=1 Tax=Agromyces humi TaxID=1766800 RepID=UPI0013587332|nr:M15 family metallopeptidase [Agromyces humi]